MLLPHPPRGPAVGYPPGALAGLLLAGGALLAGALGAGTLEAGPPYDGALLPGPPTLELSPPP